MLVVVVNVAAFPFVGFRTNLAGFTARDLFIAAALTDVPLALGTLALARWLLGASPADLGLGRPTRGLVRSGLSFGALLFLAGAAVGLAQSAVFGKEPQAVITALTHHDAGALALDALSIAILAPFAEELLFRGVVFRGLRQRAPFAVAGLVSAAAFAALHEPQAWAGVLVLGVGLAVAYERTRSLWVSMTAHAVVNGLPLLILALFGAAL